VLVLSQADVVAVLDMGELIDAVEAAMVELSDGRVSMPARVAAVVEERGAILGVMPAYLPTSGALTTKLVSVFPQNQDRPSHQALICCFDPTNGTPVAVMDGTRITAMRTAAGSAVATRALARRDARRAAVIGTGVQSGSHVEAMRILGYDVVVAGRSTPTSVEDAVRNADIVCLTTHADAPVIRREWLRSGAHVNSVGYNTAGGSGEVDRATVDDAYVVIESRTSTFAPPPSGAVELRHLDDAVEIGEIVAGRAPARTSDDQLTLYKSVGVAVQDAAAALLVLDRARAKGLGRAVDF